MRWHFLWTIVAASVVAIAWLGSPSALGEDRLPALDLATARPRLMVQLGHRGKVLSVAFSPDGKQVLTGSGDDTARLWDAASGKEIRRFDGHSSGVNSVAFSSDGQHVLTGSRDDTARLWDAASGKEIRRFEGHSQAVDSVAFSPDGKFVLTGSEDETARLWNAGSGKEIRRFEGFSNSVNFVLPDTHVIVAFSPDGKQVLTGGDSPLATDHVARLWSLASGKEIRRFEGDSSDATSVAFSPDGNHVLTGGGYKTARLWDVGNGKEIRHFDGHSSRVNSVAFSSDGKRVLTGSGDATARLWDAASGKEIRRFEGHSSDIASVAFSPDGKCVLTGSWDGTARLWDASSGKEIRRFEGHSSIVSSVAFSQDGQFVLTGGGDKTARLWDAASGKEIRRFEGHSDDVRSVAFSPDGKQVLTGSSDQTARLWDAASGREIHRFKGQSDGVTSVAFSPDGKDFLTGFASVLGTNHMARLWDAASGKEIVRFDKHSSTMDSVSVAFSPDGKCVLTGSWDGTARLWDAASGKEIRRFEGHAGFVTSVAFSPDGKQVLTGSWDKTARLWDASRGKEIRRFEGHSDDVQSVAFSPDGKQVLTGSLDCTSRIWDAATGKELCTLVSFAGEDWAVVDPEGRFDASNHGKVDGLHWVIGNEPIDLAQLHDRYYDPGLLAKKMGFNKDPLREVEAFNNPKLPEVAVTPPAAGHTTFDIHLTNRGGGIGPVVVRINGKDAIADARGPHPNPNAAVATLPIDLVDDPRLRPGEMNEIEVHAFNADGSIRSRSERFSYSAPWSKQPVGKPNIWAVVVGVSHYQGGAIDLRYPAKDAEDFGKALRIAAGRLVGPDNFHLTLLVSPPRDAKPQPDVAQLPTHDNILHALATLRNPKLVKQSDILIVYLAGHGLTGAGADNNFYYLTFDAQRADSSDPEVRHQWSVSDREMMNEIINIPAEHRVMILDTCHSGRFIEDLSKPREPDTSDVIALERIKDHAGFHVLAGCAADRASYEASHFDQGVLTYSLLRGIRGEALKDGKFVDVWKLFQFAVDNVPRWAGDVKGIQQPQTFSDIGTTFPFGEITPADQASITLAKTRPWVLLADFRDALDQDPLDLTGELHDRFFRITNGQDNPPLDFVDCRKLDGAYRVAGNYKVDGNSVTLTVRVALQPVDVKEITEFTVSGNKANVAELAKTIATEVQKRLPPPKNLP